MSRAAICLLLLVAFGCSTGGPRAPFGSGSALPASRDSGGTNRPERRDAPYLILISFDGFRPDYQDRFELPNFRRVAARGARARAMIPVFPSLTFPNHYSLVTGLHPERHGIVANTFYDPSRDETYSLSDRAAVSDGSWYRGEPIWATAERQGMVAACFYWPGSEAAIGGIRPTFWREFDSSIPNDDRVKTVLEWMKLEPARRPHLITLYFSEVDAVSHRASLDSPDIERAALSVDRTLGLLLDGVAALLPEEQVYLVLASDHGMVETSVAHEVKLDSLVDLSGVRVGFEGPVTSLHVGGDAYRARTLRDHLNARLSHGRAYLREELPERYRYRADPRAGDVVVVMNEPWRLTSPARRPATRDRFGMHGWDPAFASMHAMFLAMGPDITPSTVLPSVHVVDVYPFLTELLGLRPAAKIDGRPGVIANQLRRRPAEPTVSPAAVGSASR
jgi:predicted AlkP superfamily pyrophosphatase or phosphodiesterase